MLVSLEWLSDFLDLTDVQGTQLAERMSRTGIEIESVENYSTGLSHLLVGEVVSLAPHPDSDHLNVAQVNIGASDLSQIVCGAPNIAQGQKVIVAVPGATLPGGIEITQTQLRGFESNGMICSLQEIGFKDSVVAKEYAKGIFVLPEDAPVGTSVIDYLHLDDDILELDITPNRADALSMLGTAYEVGAILAQEPQLTNARQPLLETTTEGHEQLSVTIESEEFSKAYTLRLINDVKIQESPLWLQVRLMKAGIRPINNVVDVTNYALLLYGQPMHAFDFDKLPSQAISVGLAQTGETLTTLDGVERQLSDRDIIIKAGETPIALAGVMGGLDTEVTENTQRVLLEVANFNGSYIRQTAKRYNLRSESSARFEKGTNVTILESAGQHAAALVSELAVGRLVEGVVGENQLNTADVVVEVANDSLKRKVGITLTDEEIEVILSRLGFKVEFQDERFLVSVPRRRFDIEIEADIMEEIARIYGYDNIPLTLPTAPSQPGQLTAKQQLTRRSRALLEGLGLNQVITYVLTSRSQAELLRDPKASLVELDLPMSEERTVLRQSMLPAMIEVASYNQARQNKGLAFYETGRVFFGQGPKMQPTEGERLAILLSGEYQDSQWYGPKKYYDYFVLKGILDTYFEALRLKEQIHYQPVSDMAAMHPGRTATIMLEDEAIGFLGQIHPTVAKQHDLSGATFFAELDMDKLVAYPRPLLVQQVVPKFPSSSRDIALLVDKDQHHQVLVDHIVANAGDYLVSLDLFDRYVGDNIANDKQSLAYRLTFRNSVDTLKDTDVEAAMNRVTQALLQLDGLEIR